MNLRKYERQVYDLTDGPVTIPNLVEVLEYKPNAQRLVVLVEVGNPLNDKSLTVDAIAEAEAAKHRLANAEPAGVPEGAERDENGEAVFDADDEEPVDLTHHCNAELASGGKCTREVSDPDEVCWQHEEDE